MTDMDSNKTFLITCVDPEEREAAEVAIQKVRDDRLAESARKAKYWNLASSWQNILHPSHALWDVKDFIQAARTLGYPLFAWNGFVYITDGGDITERNQVCTVENVG